MTISATPASATTRTFGARLHEIRRQRGWSQTELAAKVDTSGPIIGRYERGDMTPSIDMARKIADVLGVTLDYLTGGGGTPEALQDKTMVRRIADLAIIPPSDRDKIVYLMDGLIRDAKARQAYRPDGPQDDDAGK
jgi:transcriptional regulator with XRE-family HTH domain